ncbi:TolC family protein [Escherichia coli]
MNRDSFYPAIACFPLLLMLAGCAPMHQTRQAFSQQTPAAQVDTALPTALKNGWPDSQWWLEYHDNQLTSLINNALQNAPDMQVAEQRIQLAEAQAKAIATQDGPQIDFSADMEQHVGRRANGAVCSERSGRRYDRPWYTNGTFGLTAGWHLDIWGKNRAEVTAPWVRLKHGRRNASKPAIAGWQRSPPVLGVANPGGVKHGLAANRKRAEHHYRDQSPAISERMTSSVEGVETDINASKTRQQLNDVAGKMKIIEARLSALTNNRTKSLKLKPVALPKVASQLPDELGYSSGPAGRFAGGALVRRVIAKHH